MPHGCGDAGRTPDNTRSAHRYAGSITVIRGQGRPDSLNRPGRIRSGGSDTGAFPDGSQELDPGARHRDHLDPGDEHHYEKRDD